METDENQKPGEGKEKEESALVRWCENPNHLKISGWLTLAFGILMTVIGFPSQIWINWQQQSCDLSPIVIGLPILIYIVRTPYNIGKKAWVYIPPDMIGLAACLILLWQYFYYG